MFIFKGHNIFFEKIQAMVDAYDPYGNLRINTLQSVVVLICLFLLNALAHLPQFNSILLIAIFGVWCINPIVGYNARIKGLCVFSAIIIPYALILGLVHHYTIITILIVGIVVFGLFKIAKKQFPPLLAMIPLIQILDYTMLRIPVAGWANLAHWMGVYLLGCGLVFGFLLIFPRIYFFRIWLRSIYLLVKELEERLQSYKDSTHADVTPAVLRHLPRSLDFASSLSYKEHGFAARRIALKLMSLSAASMALIDKIAHLEREEVDKICTLFDKFRQGITKTEPVQELQLITTHNQFFCEFYKDLYSVVRVWNQLCTKL